MEEQSDFPHVFLAAPYTQWMDPSTGALEVGRKAALVMLREALLSDGVAVFSAHHNEDWGRSWLHAEICTPADYLAIRRADVVCAVVGAPPSPGVLVELGWASALHKPVVVIIEQDPPQLIRGLHRVTDVTVLELASAWRQQDIERIVAATRKAVDTERVTSVMQVPEYPLTPLPLGYHHVSA